VDVTAKAWQGTATPGHGLQATGPPIDAGAASPAAAVTALYEAHAVGLIRLAVVLLGDRPAAEDVVQEAFAGLYRRWGQLRDQSKAIGYLRSAVLNQCRSELRRRRRSDWAARRAVVTPAGPADLSVLIGAEHSEVLAALRTLPHRQRDVLVLRFYLELPDPDIAAAMSISPGTVRSTTSRALAALGRALKEQQ
jgi:RNA polymerase sigma-70 factor (sigma-E family)